MLKNILIGSVILTAGCFLVIKTEWFISNFGRITWFEMKLGTEGGSRLGYKLIGVALLVFGLIIFTGGGNDLMTWMLAPILKFSNP